MGSSKVYADAQQALAGVVRDGMTVNPKQENPESEKQEDLSAGQ